MFAAIFSVNLTMMLKGKSCKILTIIVKEHPGIILDSLCHQLFQKLFWHSLINLNKTVKELM